MRSGSSSRAVTPPCLLIATGNPGKVREFRRLLGGAGFELITPADAGCQLDIAEGGESYEANAIAKARAYASASGVCAIADDSGIEVDALGGRPGVRSARYGGPGLDDAGRTALLLHELEGIAAGERSARYVAVVAIAKPGNLHGGVATFRAVQEGHIAFAPRGTRGFGYDPVFLVGAPDGPTQAELPDTEKDIISHRGQALRQARGYLEACCH